jgi:hypothetical protein
MRILCQRNQARKPDIELQRGKLRDFRVKAGGRGAEVCFRTGIEQVGVQSGQPGNHELQVLTELVRCELCLGLSYESNGTDSAYQA